MSATRRGTSSKSPLTANALRCGRSVAADAELPRWMRLPVNPIRRIPIPRLRRSLDRQRRAEEADPAGAAGAGAMRQVDAADARWTRTRCCRRTARVPADAEGRTKVDRRRVRAAHRSARRGDAASADAQPRHAAGDQQRDDQRPLQRHGPRRFTEPAPHLRLSARRPRRRNCHARAGFSRRSRAARTVVR